MNQAIVVFLAMAGGFISLSYELLWARCFSMAVQGRGYAFAMLLGLFLLGIAVGARLASRLSDRFPREDARQLRAVAVFIAASAAAGWLVIPAMAWFLTLSEAIPEFTALYFVAGAAVLLGAQLPLLANYGIAPDERAGIWMSYLYGANILGSVSGSLLTGFVLMDYLSLSTIVAGLTVATLLLSLVLWCSTRPPARQLAAFSAAVAVAVLVTLLATPFAYRDVYQKLTFLDDGSKHVKAVIENKSGVILLTTDEEVYAGGVYDGAFHIDLIDDVNGLVRPFSISAFHPAPKSMLLIGLATGSWARVLAEHPQLERMVIVEINPGYIELVESHSTHAALLSDPRVELIIDDGRRWLNANDERFDAIVSNTTFHWRGNAANLLSVEFLTLLQQHLNPGGLVMVNTTGSTRAVKSATEVFSSVHVYMRSVIASDTPVQADWPRLRQVLTDYRLGDALVLDLAQPAHRARLDEIGESLRPGSDIYLDDASVEALVDGLVPITDDNLGHEWEVDLF